MRQEFLNIVKNLKEDPYYAISITDDSTMNKIISTKTGSVLVKENGSVENYFENLKNSGVSSFTVQEYRKNGKGWKNTGNIVRNLTFQDKNSANPAQVQTSAPVSNPLNGGANSQMVGLGFYEAANLMANSNDKARLEEENKYLKIQNEDYKKLIDELKEDKLKNQYDATGKATQNEMILGLVQNLPAILSGFKSSASLNAPASVNEPQQNVSPVKTEMISFLSQPTVSDALVQVIYEVATKIRTEEGFADKIEDLLNPQQEQ